METVKKHKKKNFLQKYFSDFGIRQLVGLLIIGSSIALIFGLIFMSELTLIIAFSVYAAATLLSVLQSVFIMIKNNRRSPVFKRSMINLIIMAVIFSLSLFGVIFTALHGIYK